MKNGIKGQCQSLERNCNMKSIDITQYAGMSQAAAIFGMFLPDHIESYPNVQVLCADMSVAASLDRFIYQYPENFTEVGIAEQNLVGIAAGMASEGFISIAVAQAAFIAMRAYEMDRQYLGYMQNKVILVGLNSGFYLQHFGNTHYCIEDLSIMRSIPGMTVLSPADAAEAVMAFNEALLCDGPVYIRLTGGSRAQTVYKENCPFVIGENITIREGGDICIFSTGACVGISMRTAEILSQEGIEARVIDVHSLKPFDVQSIEESVDCRLIVSVEEHNVIGGLGSAIADVLSQKGGCPPLLKLGVRDEFSHPGDYDYLMTQHRLSPELIAEDIKTKLLSI